MAENSRSFFFYRFELYPKRKFTYISPSVTKIGGYFPEEFYADPDIIFKIIHPEDLPSLKKLFESRTLPKENWVFRWVKKDKKIAWLGQTIVPVRDKSGNLVAVEGAGYDITREVENQNKIKESEDKFRVLAETATTAIFIYQGENFVYVNPACTKLTGYSSKELLKKKFWEIVHPDFQKLVKERGFKRQKGKKLPSRYQFKIICKNGKERWVDFTAGLIEYQGKPAGIGTAYDITEAKINEENLKIAAEEWRITFDAIEDLISVIDLEGKILRCNKAQANFFKKSIRSLIGQKLCQLLHGKKGQIKDCPFKKAKKTKKRERCIVELKNKWFSVTADPIFDDKQRVIGSVHLMRDITTILKAERELQEKEEFLRNVFNSVQDGICILDDKLNIIMTNKAMERWYSFSMPLVGKKCFQAYHNQEEPCAICPSLKALKSGQDSYEIVPKRDKEGNIIGWLDLFSFPIFDPESGKIKGVVEYVRDVTGRREAEEKLKQTNRYLTLLSRVNEAIVRATDEQKLLNEICKIIVEAGRYTSAWIGLLNEEKNTIKLLAKAVSIKNLISSPRIACGKDSSLFTSTCEAIKNQKIFVLNRLKNETKKNKWLKEVLKKGFASMISIPMAIDKQTSGVLTIYAQEPDSFTSSDIKIFHELAEDISFGISSLRTQKEMKKTQNKLIATLNKLRVEENRAQELSRSIIEAQEKERLYLASEIHDNLLQSLVATYYFLEALDFSQTHQKAQKQKKELCQMLKASIAEGRALLRKIEPIREPDIGLNKAIKEAMELNFAGKKTVTHLSCPANFTMTNKEENINILRIVQEALLNARKHSQARNVWVKIAPKEDLLEIEIKDDGKGFEVEKLKSAQLGHFGLLTMKERAKILNGKLLIESEPGKGTNVKLLLPLNKSE